MEKIMELDRIQELLETKKYNQLLWTAELADLDGVVDCLNTGDLPVCILTCELRPESIITYLAVCYGGDVASSVKRVLQLIEDEKLFIIQVDFNDVVDQIGRR